MLYNVEKCDFNEQIVNYFKEYFPELKDKNNLLYESKLNEIKSTIRRWKKVLSLDITEENIDEFFDLVMNMKLSNLDLKEISKKNSIVYYIDLFTKLQEYAYERYYKKSIECDAMKNNRRLQDAQMDIEMQKSQYVIYRKHSENINHMINNIWSKVNDLSYISIMNSELNEIDLKIILRVYDSKGNKMDTMRIIYMPQEQDDLLMYSRILDIDKFISIEKAYLDKGETIKPDIINEKACYRNVYLYLVRKYFKQMCETQIKCIKELDKDYQYKIHNKEIYNLSDISKILYNSQTTLKKRDYKQIESSMKDNFKNYGLDRIFKKDKDSKYFIRKEEVELCLAYCEYISNRKLDKINFAEVWSFERFEKIRNQVLSVRAKINNENKEIYELVKEFQTMISNTIDCILSSVNVEYQFSKLEQIEEELAHIMFIIHKKLFQLNKGR